MTDKSSPVAAQPNNKSSCRYISFSDKMYQNMVGNMKDRWREHMKTPKYRAKRWKILNGIPSSSSEE